MHKEHIKLKLIEVILNNKDNPILKDEIISAIESILKSKDEKSTAPSLKVKNYISDLGRTVGICTRCWNGKTKNRQDYFCLKCKSIIRDRAKELA